MPDRRIRLASIANCRDLGGLTTADGFRIRPFMLLRSAHLVGATPADIDVLTKTYRLTRVIDLRTDAGRTREPDAVITGVEACPMPIFDDAVLGITHDNNTEVELSGFKTALNIPPMEDLYRMIVLEESCRENLGAILTTIMQHDFDTGSVLWHCSEGKDRCGLVSAMVLLSLDVCDRDIMDDYLLTNEVNMAKAQAFYQEIIDSGGGDLVAGKVKQAFLAQESYITAAHNAIRETYGSMESYLSQGLGISAATVDRFKSIVLE